MHTILHVKRIHQYETIKTKIMPPHSISSSFPVEGGTWAVNAFVSWDMTSGRSIILWMLIDVIEIPCVPSELAAGESDLLEASPSELDPDLLDLSGESLLSKSSWDVSDPC